MCFEDGGSLVVAGRLWGTLASASRTVQNFLRSGTSLKALSAKPAPKVRFLTTFNFRSIAQLLVLFLDANRQAGSHRILAKCNWTCFASVGGRSIASSKVKMTFYCSQPSHPILPRSLCTTIIFYMPCAESEGHIMYLFRSLLGRVPFLR